VRWESVRTAGGGGSIVFGVVDGPVEGYGGGIVDVGV
jgi:hypothetical protein